jgi:hypothetical protein
LGAHPGRLGDTIVWPEMPDKNPSTLPPAILERNPMISRLQPSYSLPIHRRALLALSLMMAAWLPGLSAGSEPSKMETIAFISDKVNQQGVVNVAGYLHDNATGKDSLTRESWEQSKFVIDPRRKCRMGYHKKITINGNITVDSDFWAMLQGVLKVEVLPIEQAWKRFDSRNGDTTLTYKADPSVSVVRLNVADGTYLDFAFYEKDLADRVGKAFEHVVDICGGGKEAF